MKKFHAGLKNHLLAGHLQSASTIVQQTLTSMGDTGTFEVFHHMKQLVHRLGLLCWVGPGALHGDTLQQLIDAFEVLDPETSFKVNDK